MQQIYKERPRHEVQQDQPSANEEAALQQAGQVDVSDVVKQAEETLTHIDKVLALGHQAVAA